MENQNIILVTGERVEMTFAEYCAALAPYTRLCSPLEFSDNPADFRFHKLEAALADQDHPCYEMVTDEEWPADLPVWELIEM